MRLTHGIHLAYCTNIHRGESWPETLAALEKHTLAVRRRVSPDQPYAIGLRLSDAASRELAHPDTLAAFRRWLKQHNCYVFTINGFPFGQFHGTRVKEQVYSPDWTQADRVAYTRRLFEILAELLPEDREVDGSVSTVPVSFKGFRLDERAERTARENLWSIVEFLEQLSRRTGRRFHLGLEPEPCCHLETTYETVRFFERMRSDRPGDLRLDAHLGVNYDCCHLAIEFESPAEALGRLRRAGILISKIHLSNALRVHAPPPPPPPPRPPARPSAPSSTPSISIRSSNVGPTAKSSGTPTSTKPSPPPWMAPNSTSSGACISTSLSTPRPAMVSKPPPSMSPVSSTKSAANPACATISRWKRTPGKSCPVP